MSVDRNIYVGPYLQVEVAVICTKKDKCKYPDQCPIQKADQMVGFCSLCGIDLKIRFTQERNEVPNLWEIPDIDSALLWFGQEYKRDAITKDYFFVPNTMHRPGTPQHTLSIEDNEFIQEDWSAVNPQEEMQWLQTAFAEEIAVLIKAVGKIQVKWGLLQWFT